MKEVVLIIMVIFWSSMCAKGQLLAQIVFPNKFNPVYHLSDNRVEFRTKRTFISRYNVISATTGKLILADTVGRLQSFTLPSFNGLVDDGDIIRINVYTINRYVKNRRVICRGSHYTFKFGPHEISTKKKHILGHSNVQEHPEFDCDTNF